jgi:hypothetical protein
MKNLFLILSFLIVSSSSFGQKYFNNGGGDNLWSNAANWSNGKPTAANAKVVINKGNPIINVNVTLGQIKLGTNANLGAVTTLTATNGSTLTFSGNNTTEILVNGNLTKTLVMDLPMVVSSSANENIKIFNANAGSGTSANITFGSSSTFTVSNDVDITFIINGDGKGTKSVSLDGAVTSGGKLIVGTQSIMNFGSTYDGSSHTGGILMNGSNTTLTVDSADDSTFLKAGTLITTGDTSEGHKIIINGKNVFKGNIESKGKALSLTFNKNQSAIGTITMGAGNLNLILDADVTSAAFADNSSADWGTATLNITGAGNNEISFGTNANGLTNAQLAKVLLGGVTPVINSSGQIGAAEVLVASFNNAGGDNLWSNAANWSPGIPTADTAKVTIDADLIVDSSKTVAQIKTNNASSAASVTITATNSSILTITGSGVTQPIQNNKKSSSFIFNLPVVFDSEGGTETLRFNNGTQDITFSSSLTLNDPLTVSGVNKNHDLNLNGSLLGAGNLKLANKAQANFGSAYDGSSYAGTLTTAGGAASTNNQVTIISNVADDGTFLKSAGSLNVTKDGASITVNGANTLKGNIAIGNFSPTLTINKNQSAIGTITMGSGTLNLALATDVTSAAFADNSSSDWGTGKVVITGAADNEVSFGTDASGITAAQLAQITMSGSQAVISDTGKLSVLEVAVSNFNNAGGDNLWSNVANWSAGIPNVATAKVTVDADLIIDTSVTLGQIKTSGATSAASVTITATNSSVLTVTGAGVTQPIQNNKKASSFIFNLPVVFDSEGGTETLRFNSGGDQSITFSSSLTLNDPLTVSGVNKLHDLNLNGSLLGAGNLKLANKAQANFGSAYDGSSYTGTLTTAGGAASTNNQVTIISNVGDDGTFLKSGGLLNVTKDGAKITVNGANSLKGNIAIGNFSPTLTINKNQSAIGTITMGSGILNLALATDVTSAAFADNSSSNWGTGKIIITGAGVDQVSIGTDVNGVTSNQLSQITVNGFSATINSSGYINSNVAPVAVDDTLTVSEDAALTSKDVITNDTDADANTLTLIAAATAGTGTVAINADGLSIDYTPAADFNGTELITYTVSDGERTDATGTLTVTVTPVNDSPVASAQSVTTIEDISIEITLSGSDIDGDSLTYEIVTNPINGSVTVADNKATYIPSSGYFGEDTFTYKINDGTVDSSTKTVTISVTSNDFDEDGILNQNDECPDTPEGTVVNYKGCPTFVLPENNNKVEITSATCIGNNDGSIGLSVVDTSYDYTVTITGKPDVKITGNSNSALVTGLAKGVYTVCFKVDGQSEYEQCFDVLIEEPEKISAFIDIDVDNKTSSFQLSGSNNYNIDINGTVYNVKEDKFTTSLPTGLSIIKVYTDLECQGIIEKEVFISEEILYYPNPTIDDVNVHISGMDKKVMISVFSEKGDLVHRKEQQIQDLSRLTEIDLSLQSTGTYIVVMEGKTVRKTFKIVKK